MLDVIPTGRGRRSQLRGRSRRDRIQLHSRRIAVSTIQIDLVTAATAEDADADDAAVPIAGDPIRGVTAAGEQKPVAIDVIPVPPLYGHPDTIQDNRRIKEMDRASRRACGKPPKSTTEGREEGAEEASHNVETGSEFEVRSRLETLDRSAR